ncbi:energy-coupling factor transporter transmembrane component T [Secundilactobacillus kimchicus]|nr:energy-coupling factor transporter transmembrane component T [Secundilactobacillus kimchicus]
MDQQMAKQRSRATGAVRSRLVFEQLNPWVTFSYYVVTIACSMVFLHPIFLLVELLIVVGVNYVARVRKQMVMVLEGSIFMVAFIMVLNPLINNRGAHVIWTFGGTLITVEAIFYGFMMALSLVIVLLTFLSYNKVLTSQKFMYLFSRISPKLTLLTMITLRFVPLFIRRLKNISQAQTVRGINVNRGSSRQRSIGVVKMMEVLLVRSFTDALQTADSMNARGYGSGQRSSYQRYRFKQRDLLCLGWFIPLSGLCFYAASQGIGRMVVYPALGSLGLSLTGWLVLLGVAVLFSFPLILEAWEWLWWNLLKS